jgi:hypothetical protein
LPLRAGKKWAPVRKVYGTLDTLLNLEIVFGEKVWPDIADFPHKKEGGQVVDDVGKVLRFVE